MLGTISKRYSNSSVFPERKGKETIELFPSWNSRSNFGKILSRARILEGHFWISSNKSYRSAVSAYNTWCKKKKSILGRMAWKFFETRQDWIFISQEERKGEKLTNSFERVSIGCRIKRKEFQRREYSLLFSRYLFTRPFLPRNRCTYVTASLVIRNVDPT